MEDINSSNDKDGLEAKNDDLDTEKQELLTEDGVSTDISDKNNKTISGDNDESREELSEAIAIRSSSLNKNSEKERGDSEVNEPQSGDDTAFQNIIDTEKAKMNVSDDNKAEENTSQSEAGDDNLELKWDDSHNTSGDTIKSDAVITEDINKKQLENEPNASDNKSCSELETKPDNNEETSEIERDIESNLEDKLLEETTENQVLDAIDIDEEELLKDEFTEENVTAVDETEEFKETNDGIDDKIATDTVTTQPNVNTNTEILEKTTQELTDVSLSLDKSIERIAEIFETQKELFSTRSDDDEDSRENLVMDINNSAEYSPIHIKTNHRVDKPDVMIEIPTQELIDIDDVLDSSDDSMEIGLDTNDKVDNVDDKMNDDRLECDEETDTNLKVIPVAAVSEAAITKDVQHTTSVPIPDNVQPSTSAPISDNVQPSTSAPISDNVQQSLATISDNVQPSTLATISDNVQPSTSAIISGNVEPSSSAPISDNVQPSSSATISDNLQPSTSATISDNVQPSTSATIPDSVQRSTSATIPDNVQPSTSGIKKMTPDTSDEEPQITDSLGLLAESSRVVDDDDDDDDDDDEEFEQYERDRQLNAEFSDDSDETPLESDTAKDEQEKNVEEQLAEDENLRLNWVEEDSSRKALRAELHEELDLKIEEENDDGDNLQPLLPELKVGVTEIQKVMKIKEEKVDGTGLETATNREKEYNITLNRVTKELEAIEKDKEIESSDVIDKEGDADMIEVDGVLKKIKVEKEDAPSRKRVQKEDEVLTLSTLSIDWSSTDSDDVTLTTVAIETVKLSDDEDEEEIPQKVPQQVQATVAETVAEESSVLNENNTEKVENLENVERTVEAEEVVEDKVEEIEKVGDKRSPDDESEADQTPVEAVAEDQQKSSESSPKASLQSSPTSSPSKLNNLTIASVQNTSIVNIVELEDDSEDDSEEPSQLKKLLESKSKPAATRSESVTSVNIPTTIEIMSTSGGNTSDILIKEGEVVITGLPKPPPLKPARLNTDEVTIKTASTTENTLVIPEAKAPTETRSKPMLGLEIFSLDSDDEEDSIPAQPEPHKPASPEKHKIEKKKKHKICINFSCPSGITELKLADTSTTVFYDATKKKKPLVCQPCADAVLVRKQKLMEGLKSMSSLLELDVDSKPHDMVEILDSESDDDDSLSLQDEDTIGEETAEFLENNLADLFNKTWKEYKLDDRLKETQDILDVEIKKLERDSKEINQMLIDCQYATDKIRNEFYATFECKRKELPSLLIYDAPAFNYTGPEDDTAVLPKILEKRMLVKRKLSSGSEVPAKKPAIPLGYTPLGDKTKSQDKFIDSKTDDDKDVSVVKLSAESAPADLPPPGELSRTPLRVGMDVYAMKNAFGPWLNGKIIEILPKANGPSAFTLCRIRFDHTMNTNGKVLPARCIAYADPAEVRMTIGTRLIALFKNTRKKEDKKESFYSGVVAEVPNPVNNYRYLVFFDDGYAQYVTHPFTRVVCESSALVWEEVHPFSRDFVREYLVAYPERPMVRLHEGQHLKMEWNGKWWPARVLKVDASLAQVVFTLDGRREWIYRGSTRLAPLYLELRAAERHRVRPMPRSKHLRLNMPYVEYTRSDESPPKPQGNQTANSTLTIQQQNEEIRRQRAVAKKSTALAVTATPLTMPQPPNTTSTPKTDAKSESEAKDSRVVYYTPKTAVRPHKLVPHTCSPLCKRTDVLTLNQLRTYNPLSKPLLSGWERQIVRFKGQREVMYRAPCGRRLRNMAELHKYLRITDSDMAVDLFDFYHATHCLAEFVMNKCMVGKKDLSHGKENVPVPCVNFYDESLPEFCSYNTERTPTSGVPLNLDPEFLCGCDCTDDCEDKTKCSCWQMTLEGARTIGLEGPNVGYTYKRLPEPLPSGIYECNSRCKCKNTCLNRVAQHPLQLKLQVFKTLKRGWGIRTLNDVPRGAFLCVYAGNLLTDATANLDGLNEGDEYLAELDYIEVVEQMKEGYEEDIPEADKKLDKKESGKEESEAEESSSSEEDETASKTDKEDDDFRPGYIGLGVMEFNKRLRRRGKNKKDDESKGDDSQNDKENKEKDKEKDSKDTKDYNEDDCITISDDEEVREPSRFAAQPGMGGNDFVSKYRSVRSYFGEDEACYIMDAKVQGNIGRYLNHSCSPNVFVQNVFVDTHDPRFPWVAFFALSHIKAGTELTWNYNYDVGSVPGKVLYCYCDAPNCRGRLL